MTAALPDPPAAVHQALTTAGFTHQPREVYQFGVGYFHAHTYRRVNPTGALEVHLFPDDGDRIELNGRGPHEVSQWQATFSGSAPVPMVIAAITAAVRAMDHRRAPTRRPSTTTAGKRPRGAAR